jgi:hypothetical protein
MHFFQLDFNFGDRRKMLLFRRFNFELFNVICFFIFKKYYYCYINIIIFFVICFSEGASIGNMMWCYHLRTNGAKWYTTFVVHYFCNISSIKCIFS